MSYAVRHVKTSLLSHSLGTVRSAFWRKLLIRPTLMNTDQSDHSYHRLIISS